MASLVTAFFFCTTGPLSYSILMDWGKNKLELKSKLYSLLLFASRLLSTVAKLIRFLRYRMSDVQGVVYVYPSVSFHAR